MEVTGARVLAFSGAGTTLVVAGRVAAALSAAGVSSEVVDVTPYDAPAPAPFRPSELAVFAVPSFGGRVPAPALDRVRACRGDATPAALVVTFGNRATDDTLLELSDAVRERGFLPVAAAEVVCHHSLMTDVAQGRPDASDLAVADKLAELALARLAAAPDAASVALAPDALPGSRPYREFGGVPFGPVVDPGACVGCGACAEQCPASAIPADDPARTDPAPCVSCFRCVAACPAGARSIGGGEELARAREAFAARCAERRPSRVVA